MTTISVPLTPELEKQLDSIAEDTGASRAAIMRKALERYNEEIAINKVLVAMNEPTLHGDLKELLKSIE